MKRSRTETERSTRPLPVHAPLARIGLTGADAPPPHDTNVPVLLIGGRRDCHVTVSHGDVSQIHAAIVNTGHALILVDLASRTGTFVNDVKITVATLRPGDRVRVGPVPIGMQFKYPPTAVGDPTRLAKPIVLRWKDDEFRLDSLPAVIGRRQACRVLIDTPDVSLAHALLLTINECPAVMDLGSRSGTFVNGERVTFAWLHGGDDLGIGGEQMALIWTGPTAPTGAGATTEKLAAGKTPSAAAAAAQSRPAVERSPAPIAAAQPAPAPIELPPAPSPAQIAAIAAITPVAAANDASADVEACIAGIEQHLFMLRGLLAARSDAVSRKMAEADARLAQLNAEREQHAARFTQLADRERLLTDRERAVGERGQQLDAREENISRREAATADASRKLEEIRTALDHASRGLSGVDVAGARSPSSIASPGANGVGTAAPVRPSRSDPPAPLVDRPLFGGMNGAPSVMGV
jgi:pSer/pThr/pTyr-binding forkhead associated (FHA) protein